MGYLSFIQLIPASVDQIQISHLEFCKALQGIWSPFLGNQQSLHPDDVIKWRHFPRYWSFVRGIHRPLVHSPRKCQWRGALMFSLICVWINGWVNNLWAGDLIHYRAHYDVIVTTKPQLNCSVVFLKIHSIHNNRTEIVQGVASNSIFSSPKPW